MVFDAMNRTAEEWIRETDRQSVNGNNWLCGGIGGGLKEEDEEEDVQQLKRQTVAEATISSDLRFVEIPNLQLRSPVKC